MPGSIVRAAVAERTWNSFHILGVFEEERRSGEPDLVAALARLLARTGKADIVISALPGEFVLKRLLELPFDDPRKLAQVVPFELEEHLPFAVEDAVIASSRVGRDGDNTIVVAALARKPDLRHHLELLEYRQPHGARGDARTCNPGNVHVAFVVDDLGTVYADLRAKGVRFKSAPVEIVHGRNKGGKAVYFVDPDDITLEFVEPAPAPR